MFINNSDLDFLIMLENKLGNKEGFSDDVIRLININEKLIVQRDKAREKSNSYAKSKRSTPEGKEAHKKYNREWAAAKKKSQGNKED